MKGRRILRYAVGAAIAATNVAVMWYSRAVYRRLQDRGEWPR